VFKAGTFQGNTALTPNTGQQPTPPIEVSPTIPLKKAQKNLTKKKTSDRINRIIPTRRFRTTNLV